MTEQPKRTRNRDLHLWLTEDEWERLSTLAWRAQRSRAGHLRHLLDTDWQEAQRRGLSKEAEGEQS